jgi:signal transduction histidine kinase
MKFINYYFKLYDFLAVKRIKANDLDLRRIHNHTFVTLCTGILMWSYAFLAFLSLSTPVPGLVGITCSIIHSLTPFLFRFTNNAYMISNIMIGSAMVHQATYSYYSGGFDSHILIWFGILPLLGGIIAGKKGVICWAVITSIVAAGFGLLEFSNHSFPQVEMPWGHMTAQALLVFGLIFLITSIIYVMLVLNENQEKLLAEESKNIEDLFRVLFHDLANPLNRISIGLSIARRQSSAESKNNGIEIATKASDSMMEITQNVRRMYFVSKGQLNSDLNYFSLNDSVEYIQKLYANELEKKNLRIEYDFKRYQGLMLLVEPVSFKNQVLGNAISNAIKFSNPSSNIIIRTYPCESHFHALEIVDTGVGIPPALMNSLFDVSKKNSRPGTAGENGTGYGMHIMKSFVEMYRGKISVESSDDSHPVSGTTIRILLNAKWDQDEAPEMQEGHMAPHSKQSAE